MVRHISALLMSSVMSNNPSHNQLLHTAASNYLGVKSATVHRPVAGVVATFRRALLPIRYLVITTSLV